MANYSILTKLIAGNQSSVDFSANTFVTQRLNVGGASESGSGGSILTKAILDSLLAFQLEIIGGTNGQVLQSNGSAGTFFSEFLRAPDDSTCIDLSSRQLFDSAGAISVNWQSRLLVDTGGNTVIDWINRRLKDPSGNNVLTWSGTNTVAVSGLSSSGATSLGTSAASQVIIGGTSSTAIQKINGGIQFTTLLTAVNYAVDASTKDYIINVNTGSAVTITLPTPSNGRVLIIKDVTGTASTHNVTVNPHVSETIDGAASYTMNTNYGSTALFSDGTNWFSFGGGGGSGSGITALTGDVTATGPGSAAATVAKIQGTAVSGTTGSVNVVFSASPTFTGTITAAAANFSSAISASNFSGSSSGANTGDQTITLTGDVTGSGTGSFAATIASHAVSNAKFRQSGALSVVGNATNGTADVADISAASDFQILRRSGTAIAFGSIDLSQTNAVGASILGVSNGGTGVSSVTTSPTATAFAGWDANKNLSANNHINGFTSIATAGGTTTLAVGSTAQQTFTGSTTQTVTLPVATTLVNGQQFLVTNLSTGIVTVQTSGANSIQAMASNTGLLLTCINTAGGTGTASWSWIYVPAQSSAIAIAQGGTGATTKTAAFDALSPMTTQGDIIFGNVAGTGSRLGIGTANQVLGAAGSNTIPTYRSIYETNSPNYLAANPNAEQDTTGWATYADAAGNIPVDGTGGSATNLTFSRSTSSPLRGSGQFSMVQANSTSLQGKGVSYDFTIDSADKAKVLTVAFDYNASSTFIASNGVTAPLNDGTTTTNAGNSDIEVFMYDKTNGVLIPVLPQVILANGANNFSFSGIFQTASNSTSYRLIFHIATTSANATGWTFLFDNVYIGKQFVVQGAAVSDWASNLTFSPSASFGTTTANKYYTRRVGDTLEVFGNFTAGTTTGATATITLPTGYAIDSSKLPTDSYGTSLGTATWMQPTSTAIGSTFGFVFYDGSDTAKLYVTNNSNSNVLTKSNANSVCNSNNGFTFNIKIPIAGQSSSTLMSNNAATRVVAASVARVAAYTATSNTAVAYDTILLDTHGAFSTSTGLYTCPVSGDYRVTTSHQLGASPTNIKIAKNGTAYTQVVDITSAGNNFAGSASIPCVAGDTLSIFLGTGRAFNVGSAPYTCTAAFELVQGPSQIAVVDTVAARYYVSSSSAPGADTPFNFDSKDYDYGGNVTTGASWKFTAPISGLYAVKVSILQGTSTKFNVNLWKNGVANTTLTRANDATGTVGVGGSTDIRLVAGDFIDIRPSTAGTATGSTAPFASIVAIVRIGN